MTSDRLKHYQTMFEERGLSFLKKHKGSDHIVDRRFRSSFGISSRVCSRVWALLQEDDLEKMKPDHLLWGLLLLKVYAFEVANSGTIGVDEKTFRKWLHLAIKKIADLHAEVVSSYLNHFILHVSFNIDLLLFFDRSIYQIGTKMILAKIV